MLTKVAFVFRLQLLRNISLILEHVMSVYFNRLLVGAPKSYDPLQPGVKSPGVLFRCPIDGDATTCTEVIVDTTGKIIGRYQKKLVRFKSHLFVFILFRHKRQSNTRSCHNWNHFTCMI